MKPDAPELAGTNPPGTAPSDSGARTVPRVERGQAPIVTCLDDVLPQVAALFADRLTFALATLAAADGGPRPVGSQMVITGAGAWGFLSGGCVEADVALHAHAVLASGEARRLVYGRGSSFFDVRLPCGGRIEVLIESIGPGDPAIARLLDLVARRKPGRYLSDGRVRLCVEPEERPADPAFRAVRDERWTVDRLEVPPQRLIVVGHDAFALAIAAAGRHQGWPTSLVVPDGISRGSTLNGIALPEGVKVRAEPPSTSLDLLRPDPWTAVVVTTHAEDEALDAILAALASPAGYVGVLGSRRRRPERFRRLEEAGVPTSALARLRSPIGLPLGGRLVREVAVAVVAEIVAVRADHGSQRWGEAQAPARAR